LRIKSHFELGEFEKVKTSIEKFTKLPSTAELKNETLEYLVKVEKAEKAAEDRRLAQNRKLEQERIEKEQRIAKEKLKQEEAESKRLDHERRLKIEQQRREENGLPLAGKWKGLNKRYIFSANREREHEAIQMIFVQEYENGIKLNNVIDYYIVPSTGIEAILVSEQEDRIIFKGSKRIQGSGKYTIECTYFKKTKSLNYNLIWKNGSSYYENYGKLNMHY
jgi:hypothetical protein